MATHAFGTKTWADVVSSAKSSSSFAEQVSQARKRLAAKDGKMEEKAWFPESIDENMMVRVKVVRSMLFLTIAEWEEKFKTKASRYAATELVIDELQDENGAVMKGIMLQDTSSPYRRVTVESEVGKRLSKGLASSSEMLRPNQHSDLMKYLVQEDVKGRNKSLKHPMSEGDMAKLVERVEARACDQKQPSGAAHAERAPLASPTKRDEMAAESSSPEVVVNNIGLNIGQRLQQEQLEKTGRGKGKAGKSRGRGKDPAEPAQPKKKARLREPSPEREGMSVASGARASTSGGSGSRRVKGKQSETERLMAQANKWFKEVKLTEAICGISQRGPVYQVRRVAEGLSEIGKGDCAEAIRLRTRIDLAEKCETAAAIWNVPPDRRQALLEECCCALDFIPVGFQKVLVEQAVKDNPLKTIADLEQWIDLVKPSVASDGGLCRSGT